MEVYFKLDRWQKEALAHKGSITIRAGRQVGKSTVIAMKAAYFARDNPGTTTLVIAASQRQSSLLFEKIRGEIDILVDNSEVEYEERPTMTKIMLKGGSRIYSLPAGRTGYFIRGFTLDLLICDEAAYIPEEVWRAVTPMIAVSRKLRGLGWVILLSTPFGKGGYFFNSFQDPDFKQFHISSENCPRIPKDFLMKERQRMTRAEYAQEYLGEFIDEWNQFFQTSLIKDCMTFIQWDFGKEYNRKRKYYLGVDFARYGGEENAFVIVEMVDKKHLKVVKAMVTKKVSITETIGRIKTMDVMFNFRKIFVDDGGIGGGVLDILLEDLGKKVVGLNNARRSIDKEGRQRGLLKEDLYSNALCLMEARNIELISDLKLLKSLKSIIYEYTKAGKIQIYGKYSHLAEAFVRSCWSIKDQGLKIYLK